MSTPDLVQLSAGVFGAAITRETGHRVVVIRRELRGHLATQVRRRALKSHPGDPESHGPGAGATHSLPSSPGAGPHVAEQPPRDLPGHPEPLESE